jgi:chemotaxis protein MotB
MEAEQREIMIIRRRLGADLDAVKGGVWKIAFADFMTAMMCFFLVMWLINAANEETKQAVASYFNPVRLANLNTKGLNDPKVVDPGPSSEDKAEPSPAPDQLTKPDPEGRPDAHNREEALFRDPYAVLEEIAGGAADAESRKSPGGQSEDGQGRTAGMNGGAAFRDPFDPAFWQEANGAAAETAEGVDEASAIRSDDGEGAGAAAGGAAGKAAGPWSKAEPTKLAVGDANDPQPLHEGESDPAPAVVDVALEAASPGDDPRWEDRTVEAPEAAEAEKPAKPAEPAKTEEPKLAKQLAEALRGEAEGGRAPHIDVQRSGDGVLISLTDDVAYGMFAIGSAEPTPEVVRIMAKIAEVLKTTPGGIVIRGHTDARPFRSDTYDNWRLSSARAQMAYYMLVRGGLDEKRVERIEGHADRELKVASDPEAAENRRIEILVRDVQS